MSVIVFVTWYYPIGLYKNAGGETVKRGGVAFMLIWVFFVYISTFAQFVMAGFELAELAGNLANCAFLFGLMFCGYVYTRQSSLYQSSPHHSYMEFCLACAVRKVADRV